MAGRLRVSETRAESTLTELLKAQGWSLGRPPAGNLLPKQEYRNWPNLAGAFAGQSKSGPGEAVPDYILTDNAAADILAVIEAKASREEIDQAVYEATEIYGKGCIQAGFSPLAMGIAGNFDDGFLVRVLKWMKTKWEYVTYDGEPIGWVPKPEDVDNLRALATTELRPSVPSVAVLYARAEEINRLLRESGLKDELRPATIAAIMIGLWKARGNIRRDAGHILNDINQSCESAFRDARKAELSKSLRVDPANHKLAVRTSRICRILESLNITLLNAEHDYLGQLYEAFFRYTGGNTIGQYFTPRHITALMADLTQVSKDEIVLDPACGTGGFLIAAIQRVHRETHLSREEVVRMIQNHLVGFEDEPITAALCVANMIFRGDGTTGIIQGDCFTHPEFPLGKATVALMNPPFPHKKTDTPPENFIERALEGLVLRGRLAVIVPASLLVKAPKGQWRKKILGSNTLLASISFPDELFQPYASSTTAMLLLEKGVPHSAEQATFFARVENDGLRLKKGVRQEQPGSQLPAVLASFFKKVAIAGLTGFATIKEEEGWAPGAYIQARPFQRSELQEIIAFLIRGKTACVVLHSPQFTRLREALNSSELKPSPYPRPTRKRPSSAGPAGTLSHYFDVFYGQKALHSKENLTSGPSLIISSSGTANGCYGFFDFQEVIEPPFATVPSTGSIGEAFVQEWPCGVTDDCLLLFPKLATPKEMLYVAAAVLRLEKWRFNYGRKMTPDRIAAFPIPSDEDLLQWVRTQLNEAAQLERAALGVLD
jgi:type I restriction enzyme M protein